MGGLLGDIGGCAAARHAGLVKGYTTLGVARDRPDARSSILRREGSVAKIVKLEHAWRRLDGRNDDGFQVAPFQGDVILWAVRWYCRYPISYRDLEEMLANAAFAVDHTTIYRWVQRYAPEMEKRLRWFWRRGFDPSWRLDRNLRQGAGQVDLPVPGIDKRGDTIDFYLFADPQRQGSEAVPGQGPARPEALGKACHAQYRQSAELWCSDHRIEARRKAGPGDGPPAGEVSQ